MDLLAIQELTQIKFLDKGNMLTFLGAWQIGKRHHFDANELKNIVNTLCYVIDERDERLAAEAA